MSKRLTLTLFLTLMTFSLFGNNGVDMNIRFFDKNLYYPDSDIYIKVELKNDSPAPYSFKIADIKEYNLRFTLRDMKNRALPLAEEYRDYFVSSNPYFYRQVNLEPGEEFAFVVNLSEYIDIDDEGLYLIEANFFPELNNVLSPSEDYLLSNRLSLSVRPSYRKDDPQMVIDDITGSLLKAEQLPPDRVTEYMLSARQKDEWEKFFLYLDLESLLLENPVNAREYLRITEEERYALIQSYKMNLQSGQNTAQQTFVDKPFNYEVLRTSYTPDKAEVIVREYFSFANYDYQVVRDYTYYLKRSDGIWRVYDYAVTNIRTE
ncbi:MAG: hypothetical protein PQJ59_07490 [Spirochaetales bacterium]|nr:hypothetical protein [Spirochaetales bacterium]